MKFRDLLNDIVAIPSTNLSFNHKHQHIKNTPGFPCTRLQNVQQSEEDFRICITNWMTMTVMKTNSSPFALSPTAYTFQPLIS